MTELLTLPALAERLGVNAFDLSSIEAETEECECRIVELNGELAKWEFERKRHSLNAPPGLGVTPLTLLYPPPRELPPEQQSPEKAAAYANSLIAEVAAHPELQARPDFTNGHRYTRPRAEEMCRAAEIIQRWLVELERAKAWVEDWGRKQGEILHKITLRMAEIETKEELKQRLSEKRAFSIAAAKEFVRKLDADIIADIYERGRWVDRRPIEKYRLLDEFEFDQGFDAIRCTGPGRYTAKRVRALFTPAEEALRATSKANVAVEQGNGRKPDPRSTSQIWIDGLEKALAEGRLNEGTPVLLSTAYDACLKALGRKADPPGHYDTFCKWAKPWLVTRGMYMAHGRRRYPHQPDGP